MFYTPSTCGQDQPETFANKTFPDKQQDGAEYTEPSTPHGTRGSNVYTAIRIHDNDAEPRIIVLKALSPHSHGPGRSSIGQKSWNIPYSISPSTVRESRTTGMGTVYHSTELAKTASSFASLGARLIAPHRVFSGRWEKQREHYMPVSSTGRCHQAVSQYWKPRYKRIDIADVMSTSQHFRKGSQPSTSKQRLRTESEIALFVHAFLGSDWPRVLATSCALPLGLKCNLMDKY